jgi:ribosome modulation factor
MANNSKQAETIRAKGAQAFRNGQDKASCPYRIPTKQGQKFAKLWLTGWLEAQETQMRDLLPANVFASELTK